MPFEIDPSRVTCQPTGSKGHVVTVSKPNTPSTGPVVVAIK